jgi:sortase (surface protein transpeptidase)
VRLRIPRIKVDAPMRGLALTPDGRLGAPPAADADLAGWYERGTSPGATGTAIVAGHVDTASGPAVFYELGTLAKGDRIEVARRDGRTAVFGVDAVEVYANDAFPDRKVYAAAARPELRVITCGGGFSPGTGYEGNVVAYAHLTGVR